MLNALRLREGFTKTQFEQRTGLPYTVIADKVSVLQKQGLMDTTDEQVTTTIRGYHFLNSVLGYFV